ncbi:Trace amine-associated receptor 8 [Tupaia chinensis]|uniref:Trace amine-associated receptor 8 n=1 Tax=Tupaia chinensis TaxID=246437 RepID=L9L390_TUPCH|nr:Trace amine-associated receptor 8 [Tupaia chinensis]
MASNISQPAVQLCYENVNGSCIKVPYSPGSRVILYAVFGLGSLLALFGNLLVMTSVLHFKQLHSPTNFLIASLACADFLLGMTVMPFSMVRSVESCWYFGAQFCTLHICFDVAFCFASLFHLCFISIDRYIAVTDPLVYPTKFTVPVSGVCISISWVLPVLYSGAVFYTGVSDDGMEDLVETNVEESSSPKISGYCHLATLMAIVKETPHTTWRLEVAEELESLGIGLRQWNHMALMRLVALVGTVRISGPVWD